MKITIDVDCTPEEARRFLGLPDVAQMQDAMMAEVQKRMMAGLETMDPETILRTWLPIGLQELEKFQKMFWARMTSAGSEAKGDARTRDSGTKTGASSGPKSSGPGHGEPGGKPGAKP